MAKFEAPPSEASGFYLTKDEREALLGEDLTVVAVREDLNNTYKGKPSPRFVVTFNVDGEERGWGFHIGTSDGSESSRDRLLYALKGYLEGDDVEETQVLIERVGGNFLNILVPDTASAEA